MMTYTFRVKPGKNLFDEIEQIIAEKKIEAGCMLCSVGNLMHTSLRLASHEVNSEYEGYFEIVSLTGTLSANALTYISQYQTAKENRSVDIFCPAVRFTRQQSLCWPGLMT